VKGELYTLTNLPPVEEPWYPPIRRMGGLQTQLDILEKKNLLPQTVQSIAYHCIEYTILAPALQWVKTIQ
jgi:hypothetical protein